MADKLPWFPFYPDDWLSDEKLRACSDEAKSLWIDMLCLMHKNDRRGYLQLGDKPPTPEQLARMTGRSAAEVSRQLAELTSAGVPSATEHGVLYSRKMVRAEGKRQKCSEAGRKGGGNPAIVTFKGISKGGVKGGVKGHSGSGSLNGSLLPEEGEGGFTGGGGAGGPDGFDEFWAAYPRRTAKAKAREAWRRLGLSPEARAAVLAAVARQKGWRQWREGVIPHAATWLNQRRWEDEPPPERAEGRGAPPESPEQKAARLAREKAARGASEGKDPEAVRLWRERRGLPPAGEDQP